MLRRRNLFPQNKFILSLDQFPAYDLGYTQDGVVDIFLAVYFFSQLKYTGSRLLLSLLNHIS